MNQHPLNRLEAAVIEMLLRGDHPALAALREQVAHCQVTDREMTGVGFFTKLSVGRSSPPAPALRGIVRLGDVEADIEGLEHGAGFVLVIEDGSLRELEGYSYDEPWPATIGAFSVRYVNVVRDLQDLQPK